MTLSILNTADESDTNENELPKYVFKRLSLIQGLRLLSAATSNCEAKEIKFSLVAMS